MTRPMTRIDEILAGKEAPGASLMRDLEDQIPGAEEELIDLLAARRGQAPGPHLIGITGGPGSGKSTLVDQLIVVYRKRNLRVGVVAVDPSSPFSGGALLGDRIRMQRHAADRGVFVRS